MNPARSLSDRLTRGLTWTGGIGGLALIIFISFDVDILLEQQSANVGWRGESLEIAEHVVLPLIVLMAPLYFAVRWVIRTSLISVTAAADRIDAVTGTERGFRLDTTDLPTEIHPFAHAINNLLGRLDNIAEQREVFAAVVAHELKTPLAILLLELDRPEIEASRLKADVMAMSRLLDQILLMAQLEAHAGAPVNIEPVNIADVTEEVVARLAPVSAKQGKHLELEIRDSGIVRIRREALAAAIRNLIENALRVTPPAGVVSVRVGPGNQIAVRDGGPGLTAKELEYFCKPFARADDTGAHGSGLGLAIVSRVMAFHGGQLDTDPNVRELRLSLPVTEQN